MTAAVPEALLGDVAWGDRRPLPSFAWFRKPRQ